MNFGAIAKRFSTTPAAGKFPFGQAVAAVGIPAGVYYYYQQTRSVTVESRSALNPEKFVSFKLKEVIPINYNTASFRFELPKGATELGLPTASCLVTRYQAGQKADGSPEYHVRPYTPIETDSAQYFDLLVKKYPDGRMSGHIHSLKPGDELEMKGPISKWPYSENQFKEIGMIAGGTGITPMLQILHKIAGNPNDKTQVSLVFANNEERDILLEKELKEMAAKRPGQIKVFHVLAKPPNNWKQGAGFVNEDHLKQFMPKPGSGKVFVCGPPPMYTAISGPKAKDKSQGELGGVLKKMGYSESDVFKF